MGVKEEPEPRELRRCCARRLPARQVPRGQAPAKLTNFASRTLRDFRGREQVTLRSPNKLKFLASRCPCASPGACRRARSRESVPSRTWSSKRCARILEILRFKELQFFGPFCRRRNYHGLELVLASCHKVSRPHDSVQALISNSLNISCFTCRWTATRCAQMQHHAKIDYRSIRRTDKLSTTPTVRSSPP
jgi:hypothetical protein